MKLNYSKQDIIAIKELKEYVNGKKLNKIKFVATEKIAIKEYKDYINDKKKIELLKTIKENLYTELKDEIVELINSDKQEDIEKIIEQISSKISNGKDGQPGKIGKIGKIGKTGQQGKDGQDAKSPSLEEIVKSLKKDKSFIEKTKGEPGQTRYGADGGGLGLRDVQAVVDEGIAYIENEYLFANKINVNTTSFNKNLTSADIDLQKVVDRIDDLTLGSVLSAGPNIEFINNGTTITISADSLNNSHTQRVDSELNYNRNYDSCYKEYTYTGVDVTGIDIWVDNSKITKLFTKTLFYTAGKMTSSTLIDNINNITQTKIFVYSGTKVSNMTETYS